MLDDLQADEDRLREFVANASHELRTPVSVIRSITELWGQGHLRSGAPFDDALRRIGQESARMRSLVEELLLLARLDEDRPLAQVPVDFVSVVQGAVLDESASYPSRSMGYEGSDSVVVLGDEPALRQVVTNLVHNALVHTPSTARVTVRLAGRHEMVVLEVTDSGPGMNPEDAARAFDRFWRADANRSRPGSGLGLPIVTAIASAHGGSVAMDTSPEAGTTVRVVLPVAIRKQPADVLEALPISKAQDPPRGTPYTGGGEAPVSPSGGPSGA
jgi:two-component system OmpR family sensor kinase